MKAEYQVYLEDTKPIKAVVKCVDETPLTFPTPVGPYYNIKRGKHSFSYVPIYAGFDIETTNIISEDSKLAFMYHAQFCIASREEAVIYLMRTWDDVVRVFDELVKFYKTDEKQRLVLWDANLSFELQFLRHRLDWDEGDYTYFAKEKREALFVTYKGIEMRECLSISGGSLAQLCKDYCHTQKAVGDLDYKKLRNSTTPLDDTEYGYIINDVIPLSEWAYYMFERFCRAGHTLPLTKTGVLRREVRERFEGILGSDSSVYKTLIKNAHPDERKYSMWSHFLFRGGYVHANVNYVSTRDPIPNVQMFDITSSYPARMNMSLFPGKFYGVKPTQDNFDYYFSEGFAMIATITFTGLEPLTPHSIESSTKAIELSGAVIDNGRIRRAKKLTVMLTDVDFKIYKLFYKWKTMKVNLLEVARYMTLPPYLLQVLNEHYKEKAELKKAGLQNTPRYAIVKSGVNAMFGLTVTRIELDKVVFLNGEWDMADVKPDFEDEVDKQILLPQWGIWISAQARYELLSVVKKIEDVVGDDYVDGAVIYNDTDSIKCVDDPRIFDIIKEYNEGIAKRLQEVGLTDPAFSDLGMFDYEGKAVRFKTLGAKRYMTEEYKKDKETGEKKLVCKATIAGLPKVAVKNLGADPFAEFTIDGFVLDKDKSHKTTHRWNDELTEAWVDGELMREESSVAIYEIPFSLKLDKDYYVMCLRYMERMSKKL